MLEHGGRLRRAAEDYGIALADWVDLSTGISPWAYPVPPVPEAVWQRLPEDDDGLDAAAARYYGSAELLAVGGSQPAIQALPAILPGARVAPVMPFAGKVIVRPEARHHCRTSRSHLVPSLPFMS